VTHQHEFGGADVKRGGLLAVVLFAMAFVTASAVMAHHGTAGYDETNMSTFPKVTITEVEWANPHCQIHFDVTNDKGVVEHWNVEAPPPSMLAPREWTRKRDEGTHPTFLGRAQARSTTRRVGHPQKRKADPSSLLQHASNDACRNQSAPRDDSGGDAATTRINIKDARL
jgi:hypothetical protein